MTDQQPADPGAPTVEEVDPFDVPDDRPDDHATGSDDIEDEPDGTDG